MKWNLARSCDMENHHDPTRFEFEAWINRTLWCDGKFTSTISGGRKGGSEKVSSSGRYLDSNESKKLTLVKKICTSYDRAVRCSPTSDGKWRGNFYVVSISRRETHHYMTPLRQDCETCSISRSHMCEEGPIGSRPSRLTAFPIPRSMGGLFEFMERGTQC